MVNFILLMQVVTACAEATVHLQLNNIQTPVNHTVKEINNMKVILVQRDHLHRMRVYFDPCVKPVTRNLCHKSTEWNEILQLG